MNILITGITGFVGSHLADYIINFVDHISVYGLVRWRSPLDNISHLVSKNRVTLLRGDLLDLPSIERALYICQPKIVFHLAAQSYVPYSYEAPISTLQTNVIGSANLFYAAEEMAYVPTIHVSSSSEVYGQPEYTPIDEKHPLNPISPYGVSKAAMDMLAWEEYKAHDLPTIRTRAFTHTGPRRGDVFVASAFAKQIAEIEAGQRDILYTGNLDSIRTWCDVRDMVRAYWDVQYCIPGEIYNVGGDRTTTIGEMLDILISFTSAKIIHRVDPSLLRPADVTLQIPDTSKFQEQTGWEPKITLEKTLSDLLDYQRERVGNGQ